MESKSMSGPPLGSVLIPNGLITKHIGLLVTLLVSVLRYNAIQPGPKGGMGGDGRKSEMGHTAAARSSAASSAPITIPAMAAFA